MDEDKILEYVSRDQFDIIRDIKQDDIFTSLLSIKDSDPWNAMFAYIINRTNTCQSVINATDPIKDPSKILKYQGMIDGLWDMFRFYKEKEAEFESKK